MELPEIPQTELLILAVLTLVAIIGLIMVILQLRGKIKSVKKENNLRTDVSSGGTVMLLPTLLSMMILGRYSAWLSLLYGLVIIGAYILVQFLFRDKGEKK